MSNLPLFGIFSYIINRSLSLEGHIERTEDLTGPIKRRQLFFLLHGSWANLMIVSLEGWAGCHGHQFRQLEITCFGACSETSEKDTGLERKKRRGWDARNKPKLLMWVHWWNQVQ